MTSPLEPAERDMPSISPRILAMVDETAANLRATEVRKPWKRPDSDLTPVAHNLSGMVHAATTRHLQRVWWSR